MYTYTYLLSHSYRITPPPAPATPTTPTPSTTVAYRAPTRSQCEFKDQSKLEQLKQHYHQLNRKKAVTDGWQRPIEDLKSNQVTLEKRGEVLGKEQLETRLKNLACLGQKHQQALRQVDLQDKLLAIEAKYAHKERQLQERYSCQPQPQPHKPLQQQVAIPIPPQQIQLSSQCNCNQEQIGKSSGDNEVGTEAFFKGKEAAGSCWKWNRDEPEVSRQSVKTLVKQHLSQVKPVCPQKRSGHQLMEEGRRTARQATVSRQEGSWSQMGSLGSLDQNIPNQNGCRMSVQKLSNLQQKIKSSLQPYLNI